ncbi:MAG: glycosyl transferase [Chloroflexi bacterium]|nr:glycosyl transferase [Chloroflexota bacterium]
MNIIVGIPAFNEEKNIARILSKIKEITDTVIVCDDGSTDSTSKIANNHGALVINHEKNLGYGAAIRSIFLKAKEMSGDVLVTFDADGQHRIEDISKVARPIQDQKADIVIGSRFLSEDISEVPEYRKFGIKIITKITNASIKENLTDSQSGFRAYSKKVLSDITPIENGMGVSTEILIKASTKDMKIAEVPIKVLYQGKTSTHNPVSHGTSVVLSTVKFTSIEHPLKFYGIPGIIISSIGLFFIIWTLQEFSETGSFPPILALISIGSFLAGLVLLIAAILLHSLISVIRENNTSNKD